MLKAPYNPDFERLRRALLLRGEPDRVPLGELSICAEVQAAFLGRPLRSMADQVAFRAAAGFDFVQARPILPAFALESRGAPGRQHWLQEQNGPIASLRDIEAYPWPEVEEADFSQFAEAAAALPTGMKTIAWEGDIFTRVWAWMGYERFCCALADDPTVVEALFQRVGELVSGLFARAVEQPKVGAVWLTDDIAYASGLMVSPWVLRRFLFPWYRHIADLCQSKGLPFLYHSDGRLWEVMEDLIACGFCALHPVEPKAMDILEVKRRYGRRLALIGNVEVGETLVRGRPGKVREEVHEKIAALAPGGGYCIASSNSIPNYVPYENFLAMLEAAWEFGKYLR